MRLYPWWFSTRISVREYGWLLERAKGKSVSEYIKGMIEKAYKSDNEPKYKTIGGTRFKVEDARVEFSVSDTF